MKKLTITRRNYLLSGISALMLAVIEAGIPSCSRTLPEIKQIPISERNNLDVKQYLDNICQDIPIFTANSELATGFSNLTRADKDDIKNYSIKSFSLDDKITIEGLYIPSKKQSHGLVIATLGFMADKMAQPAYNLINIVKESVLSHYDVLILDHPTSAPFTCLNGIPNKYSWGGIEEGYFIVQIAEIMKAKNNHPSINLLGISMGAMGVIHAAYRSSRMLKSVITSAITFSAVTDYLDVPANTLRNIEDKSDFAFDETHWNFVEWLNTIGFTQLFDGFQKIIAAYPNCAYISKDNLDTVMLGTERYDNLVYMNKLIAPYLNDSILATAPKNLESYLSACDATKIAANITIPLLVVHSDDDNIVPKHHYYRFMHAATRNNKIMGIITGDGGHWGFSAAYGEKWVGCLIKTYFDYWNRKKFKLNKECF